MYSKEVVKNGYLTKSPPDNKTAFHGWKKRYFILIDSTRVYPFAPRNIRIEYYTNFEESKSGNPLGLIELNSCSGVLKREQMKSHKNVFDIVTPTRVFHLSADSMEERDLWVDVLNTNVFTYNQLITNQRNIHRFDPNRRSSDFTSDIDTATALLNSMSRETNITRARGGPRAQSVRSTKSVTIDQASSIPDMFIANYPAGNPAKLPDNLRLITSPEQNSNAVFDPSVCDNEIFSEKGFTAVPIIDENIQLINNESPYMNVSFTSLSKSANVSATQPLMPSPYKKLPQSVSVSDLPHQKLSNEPTPSCVDPSSMGSIIEEYAKIQKNK